MTINISIPDVGSDLHPQITVLGVGGSGGNAVNNMMNSNLEGVDFLIANTDAQALQISKCKKKIQLGVNSTRGLGAGMRPDVGRQAAEEAIEEISAKLEGSHMLFIAAGMGGGTGTGASPIIAKLAREKGILTVGVVTKPFHFEGIQRMKLAEKGLDELQQYVDTLLTIPNQNLFRIANEKTTFADAFKMADDVLYAGVRGVTDLMVQPGLINLDFSDVKTVMSEMGKAMMGTGEASGEGRSIAAAEAAIANPLIDDVSLKGAKGLIINITGGQDITLYEVDEAANRIKQEVDENANIIYGTTCDDRLEGVVRVSIVATGIDANNLASPKPFETPLNISIDNSVYYQQTAEENVSFTNSDVAANTTINDLAIVNNENKEIAENIENHNEEIPSENEQITNSQLNVNEEDLNATQPIQGNEEVETEERGIDININEVSDVNADDKMQELSTTSDAPEDNESKATVRKLSLFDTLDDQSNSHDTKIESEKSKSEPVFEGYQEENISDVSNHEFAENELETEVSDNDEEFNQENEEELLDIPTFLRRQAN